MKEQFIKILEKGSTKEMVTFLKSLNDDQKRELSPFIKATNNDYLKHKQVTTGTTISFVQKANETQRAMLLISSFACLTRTDFEKIEFPVWILEEKILKLILPWYCPPWFSDFVNKQAGREFIPFYISYDWIMELTEGGYLQPSNELIVKLLPQYIFENNNNTYLYKPEKLLKYQTTLTDHIWLLFHYESNLHYSDRFLHFGKEVSKEKIGWLNLFKQFSQENRLDRFRLLKESLFASNRNFNKVLSGWFIELFNHLEPGKEEILRLQNEMFTVLSSPHSKPIGVVLNCFKKILSDKNFKTDIFLDNTPILLSSTTKNIVASTLIILEKLAIKNNEKGLQISKLVMQVFIHQDDDLQTRAAKIIADNQKEPDDSFKNELAVYFPTMMLSAKNILKEFEITNNGNNPIKSDLKPNDTGKNEWTEIPPIENFDDLIFLASQAFDNNQSWHIDWLPDGLVRFQNQLRGENIDKLEPALQRALKMIGTPFRSTQGFLDHLLAVFFIDVCVFLTKKYPNESNGLQSLFGRFDQKEGDKVSRWLAIGDNQAYLVSWDNHHHDPCYLPFKQLLLSALEKIRAKSSLPVLSTPTHEPGWIKAEALVKRLIVYQQESKEPDNLDLQIAISRCLLKDSGAGIDLAKAQLIGEFRNLMLFLLDENAEPQAPFDHPAAWMTASLSKTEKKTYTAFEVFSYYKAPFQNYTGQYQWQSVDEEYTANEYNYELRKSLPVLRRRKILRVEFPNPKQKEGKSISKLFSQLVSKQKEDPPLLCSFLTIKATFLEQHHNDARRILLLTPNNPEPFLARVLDHCLKYPSFWNEADKRMIIACLQTLHEIWGRYGNMAHVFLGTCMLASDKTVANIAAEIWLKSVSSGTMSNEQLGTVIGLHERIEFAPLKRFTDLVSQTMFRVSDEHNRNLRILIDHILVELPDEPIKNLKKLLEIYSEVSAIGELSVSKEKLIDRFNKWKLSAGLSKVVMNLEQRTG